MKKILIIGSSGQLGLELTAVSKLLYKVFPFSHKELDITDEAALKKIFKKIKPDIVINTTAYHVVSDCEQFPDKAFLVNTSAIKNLAMLCNEFNIHLVHFSTDYVFDGLKGTPYLEKDQPNPVQVYGVSKYAGELLCLQYHDKVSLIRSSGIYGGIEGSKSKKGNFVLNIIARIKHSRKLEVSSEQIVSPTYAVDLASATIRLIRSKKPFGIFHLVNEGYCSWATFAAEIVKLKGSKTKIIPVNRKGGENYPKRPLISALTNKKAKKLGIVLPSWKEALQRYIEFLH